MMHPVSKKSYLTQAKVETFVSGVLYLPQYRTVNNFTQYFTVLWLYAVFQ